MSSHERGRRGLTAAARHALRLRSAWKTLGLATVRHASLQRDRVLDHLGREAEAAVGRGRRRHSRQAATARPVPPTRRRPLQDRARRGTRFPTRSSPAPHRCHNEGRPALSQHLHLVLSYEGRKGGQCGRVLRHEGVRRVLGPRGSDALRLARLMPGPPIPSARPRCRVTICERGRGGD